MTSVVLLLAAAVAGVLRADEVVTRNGSRLLGEILDMVGGKLRMRTPFATEVVIDWAQVAEITSEQPLRVILQGDTELVGPAARAPAGRLAVREPAGALVDVGLETVTAINPPVPPALTLKGFAALGASVTNGNTQTKNLTLNAEIEARYYSHRLTLRAATNYAEDEERLTARNSRGNIKYDYFVYKRLYLFASVLLENDEFQDLKLRTALSAGPGYQFVEPGDFKRPFVQELQISGEAGISYFDEDYEDSPDQQYAAARWAVKVDWPILPKRVVLFHVHEGYPGLERGEDIYITTEQGVRFTILENFFAAVQVNWRWDNTPAPDHVRSDTTYLFSLGYNFQKAFK